MADRERVEKDDLQDKKGGEGGRVEMMAVSGGERGRHQNTTSLTSKYVILTHIIHSCHE